MIASSLSIHHLTALPGSTELFALIDRLSERFTVDEYPLVSLEKEPDSITYHFSEKQLALRAARTIQKTYQHLQPEIVIHNPHHQLSERVIINFDNSTSKIRKAR